MNIMTDYFLKTLTEFDYKTNIIFCCNLIITFIFDHKNIIVLFFHLIVFLNLLVKIYSNIINSKQIEIEKKRINRKLECLDNIFSEKEEVWKLFETSYHSKNKMIHCVDMIVSQFNDFIKTEKQLHKDTEKLDKQYNKFLHKKLKDIEDVLINNNDNYIGEEWTMELLEKKAFEMRLPDIKWGSRSVLGFVIRIVEQLLKIDGIIEPIYADGYETEEIEDK